jgi:hypothetical protein
MSLVLVVGRKVAQIVWIVVVSVEATSVEMMLYAKLKVAAYNVAFTEE